MPSFIYTLVVESVGDFVTDNGTNTTVVLCSIELR